MSATERVPVIWNAKAGGKNLTQGAATADQLIDLLGKHGLSAQVYPTESEAEARQVVRGEIGRGAQLIVGAGGDGTVGLIAEEALGKDVAVGILPLGSVMNLCRNFGIPRDLEGAAAALAAGKTAVIDVGEANGTLFYEAVQIGLNAAIFGTAEHFADGDWGSPLRAIATAFRYQPVRIELLLDGDRKVSSRALLVAVANGVYSGVGMALAPDARLDDGLFDVRVFSHFSKPELLRHLVSIAFGRRGYVPHVQTYPSATIAITSSQPLPGRADARDLGTTPIECRVRPRSLKVIVGPDFSEGRPASI